MAPKNKTAEKNSQVPPSGRTMIQELDIEHPLRGSTIYHNCSLATIRRFLQKYTGRSDFEGNKTVLSNLCADIHAEWQREADNGVSIADRLGRYRGTATVQETESDTDDIPSSATSKEAVTSNPDVPSHFDDIEEEVQSNHDVPFDAEDSANAGPRTSPQGTNDAINYPSPVSDSSSEYGYNPENIPVLEPNEYDPNDTPARFNLYTGHSSVGHIWKARYQLNHLRMHFTRIHQIIQDISSGDSNPEDFRFLLENCVIGKTSSAGVPSDDDMTPYIVADGDHPTEPLLSLTVQKMIFEATRVKFYYDRDILAQTREALDNAIVNDIAVWCDTNEQKIVDAAWLVNEIFPLPQ
ncbi:hypothetical protein P280DRAFT_475781 [Massarina eburnea CBS 473.64]|uniref:Uncharacterized protein n=1 Tax=Massarina eburnea CBS 473.64 TaxID=1395130 RepID=A0A6A6SFL5_9PLEO|nr:hypothetical protein P280DRAFT_475781 [Massarina eburnea CBS 473.64]